VAIGKLSQEGRGGGKTNSTPTSCRKKNTSKAPPQLLFPTTTGRATLPSERGRQGKTGKMEKYKKGGREESRGQYE